MTDDQALNALIERMEKTKPLSQAEERQLTRAARDAAMAAAMNGGPMRVFDDLSILCQSEGEFRSELRSIENDLRRQVAVVQEGLDIWFRQGIHVPPYYAWRVAIILSKAKRKDDERRFLAAWCRHFGDMAGGRYAALKARADKAGAI